MNLRRGAQHVLVVIAGSANADIQGLAGAALASSDTPVATRALLIDVARQSGAAPLPVAWVDGLARVLSEDDPTLSWEALAAVRTRGWRQFDEVVRSLSNNERLTAEIRVAALECLSAARQSLDAEAFDFLTDQLSETTAPLLRLAAARTLGASPLSKSQLLQVAGHSRQVSTMILRVLLPLFAASNDAEVGASIVEALQASPAAEGLTAAELDSYLMNYPLAVRQQAARLRAKIVVGQHEHAVAVEHLHLGIRQDAGQTEGRRGEAGANRADQDFLRRALLHHEAGHHDVVAGTDLRAGREIAQSLIILGRMRRAANHGRPRNGNEGKTEEGFHGTAENGR